MADTAHAAPWVYQPGERVTVTGYVDARWCVLSEYVAYRQINRYFLLKSLAATPEGLPEPLSKRRRRQLMKKN
ncbi:hypothetical protein Q5H92_13120 [Hymenobacter sp. M29]|uniref:Uncharacterized protein n=1 Tax=Hymenobacter mellowenesis TaxID=3063995 RepID=A0ABT9AD15_9BACT|nr:hypothetical protein [Hymenobacter sp. M29]